MRRRAVLAGLVASLGGCAGMGAEQPAEASTTTEERPDPNELFNHTSEPENTETTTSVPNQETRQEVLNRYNDGAERMNTATGVLNDAITNLNNNNTTKALNLSEMSREAFQNAESEFSTAYDKSLQLDSSEAQGICDTARQYAGLMAEAALETHRAAEDFQNGNTEQGNSHIDEHQSIVREAEQNMPRDPPVLKNVLNL